jgi:hypothetical protein
MIIENYVGRIKVKKKYTSLKAQFIHDVIDVLKKQSQKTGKGVCAGDIAIHVCNLSSYVLLHPKEMINDIATMLSTMCRHKQVLGLSRTRKKDADIKNTGSTYLYFIDCNAKPITKEE